MSVLQGHLPTGGEQKEKLFQLCDDELLPLSDVRPLKNLMDRSRTEVATDSTLGWGVLVSVNYRCFSPSRFSHFHCNTMRKAIKGHKNLYTNYQNEHTPDDLFR